MKLKKWDRVEVFWIDSLHVDGWLKEKGVEVNEKQVFDWMKHQTIGYVFQDAKKYIAVAQSYSTKDEEDRSVDSIMRIPRVAIEKMVKL